MTTITKQTIDTARIEAEARTLRSQEVARVGGLVGRLIANAVRNFFDSIAEARRIHITYNELSVLSDRELRDIGLNRSEIGAAAAGVLRRPVELTAIDGRKTETTPAPVAAHDDIRLAA